MPDSPYTDRVVARRRTAMAITAVVNSAHTILVCALAATGDRLTRWEAVALYAATVIVLAADLAVFQWGQAVRDAG